MGGRRRPRAVSVDDMGVDYTCILDTEDRRRRWSEAVTDSDLRNSVRLNKLFRRVGFHFKLSVSAQSRGRCIGIKEESSLSGLPLLQ